VHHIPEVFECWANCCEKVQCYSLLVQRLLQHTFINMSLQVFRLLRSLRPLRVINRAPGLKLVVQTLLSSLRPIGNIVLICCTFFIIFGILGVQVKLTHSLFFIPGIHRFFSHYQSPLSILTWNINVTLSTKHVLSHSILLLEVLPTNILLVGKTSCILYMQEIMVYLI
jgi:hypothetical protein